MDWLKIIQRVEVLSVGVIHIIKISHEVVKNS
jgi:hypothetical protein